MKKKTVDLDEIEIIKPCADETAKVRVKQWFKEHKYAYAQQLSKELDYNESVTRKRLKELADEKFLKDLGKHQIKAKDKSLVVVRLYERV